MPEIAIDLHSSLRLLVAWVGWCSALALSIALGSGLPLPAKSLALLLLTGLGFRGWQWLQLRDRWAVHWLCWESQGQWRLRDREGGLHYVALMGKATLLGPLIWLPLQGGGRRFIVLIDAKTAEPAAICALKGRLTLETRR